MASGGRELPRVSGEEPEPRACASLSGRAGAHAPFPGSHNGLGGQSSQTHLELVESREGRVQHMLPNNFFWENYNFVFLAQDTHILPDVRCDTLIPTPGTWDLPNTNTFCGDSP